MHTYQNKNLIVSGAHSLRLLDVEKIYSFGILDGGAYMLTTDLGIEMKAVPGSIQPTDTAEEGLYHKLIAFRLGQVSRARTLLLESLTAEDLVAIYVDEHGHNRVAGNLDWPMRFTFSIAGGLYECHLECRGLEVTPYLAD